MNYTKTCSICKQEKPLNNFYERTTNNITVHIAECKDCNKERIKKWVTKRKTEIKPVIKDKFCPRCQCTLPVSSFLPDPTRKDGFYFSCRKCEKAYRDARFQKIKNSTKKRIEGKKCSKCKQYKLIEQFHKCNINLDGRTSWCKTCVNSLHPKKEKPALTHKICPQCKLDLPITEFTPNLSKPNSFYCWCKKCTKLKSSIRRKRIKDLPKPALKGKTCTSCKLYKLRDEYNKCQSHKDGLGYSCKECVKTAKIKTRGLSRQRDKERYHKDSVFRMQQTIRARIKMAIKNQSKSGKSLELLGCTGPECMNYLEKLFWPGMTKENYGKTGWVIDHIKPVDAFDKTNPKWQFECFHYTNLQPLWWEDNNIKLARLDWSPKESKHELPERLKQSNP